MICVGSDYSTGGLQGYDIGIVYDVICEYGGTHNKFYYRCLLLSFGVL